ncbi:MAG: hypothetical protein MUF72_21110 [Elainella sp. Prado103]|jgi:hypothetical protein|nr:hypothetical protein [Elainella sp. Prado103]
MKRQLTTLFISFLLLMGTITIMFVVSPIASFATPLLSAAAQPNPFMEKLKIDILPQLEDLLSPEQIAAFDEALESGNLRKAFEAATLTTEQKDQVSALFKSLPKGSFNSLSSADKQEFFLSQKAAFFDKDQFVPDFEAIQAKKKAFMPDLEAIQAKKKAFMPDLEAIQDQQDEAVPNFKTFMPDFKAIQAKKKAFMPDLDKIIEERQAAKAAEAGNVTE